MKKTMLTYISAFLAPMFCFTVISSVALATDRRAEALKQWNNQALSQFQIKQLKSIHVLLKRKIYEGVQGTRLFLKHYRLGLEKARKQFQKILQTLSEKKLVQCIHWVFPKKSNMLLKRIRTKKALQKVLIQAFQTKKEKESMGFLKNFLKKHSLRSLFKNYQRKLLSKSIPWAKIGKYTLITVLLLGAMFVATITTWGGALGVVGIMLVLGALKYWEVI